MQEGQSHSCTWNTEILLAFISFTKLNQIICNEHLALFCAVFEFVVFWLFFFNRGFRAI